MSGGRLTAPAVLFAVLLAGCGAAHAVSQTAEPHVPCAQATTEPSLAPSTQPTSILANSNIPFFANLGNSLAGQFVISVSGPPGASIVLRPEKAGLALADFRGRIVKGPTRFRFDPCASRLSTGQAIGFTLDTTGLKRGMYVVRASFAPDFAATQDGQPVQLDECNAPRW